MSPGLADPAWWPKPPPRQPQPLSVPVLVGSAVALGAAAAVVVLVVTLKHGSADAVAGRSAAAFTACLKGRIGSGAGVAPDVLRQGAEACRSHLPPGTRLPDFDSRSAEEAGSGREAYAQCLQSAFLNLRRSARRQSFRTAATLCRALVQGAGPGGSAGTGTFGGTSPTSAPSQTA